MDEKWITFDLDGTLMQNPFVGWIFPEIEGIFKEKCSPEIRETVKPIQLLVEEHNNRMKNNQIVEAYDWDQMVEELFTNHDIHGEKIDITTLVHKHTVEGKVYLLEEEDKILPTLQSLKEKGYKLAAITNGYYKYQAPVLKELKLYDYFDAVITPEKVGAAKPNVSMLTHLPMGTVVAHVGDRIDHDVCFANEANVTSVLISRSFDDVLLNYTPSDRVKQACVRSLCEAKWNKEQQTSSLKIPEVGIPDAIIVSIEELKEIF